MYHFVGVVLLRFSRDTLPKMYSLLHLLLPIVLRFMFWLALNRESFR